MEIELVSGAPPTPAFSNFNLLNYSEKCDYPVCLSPEGPVHHTDLSLWGRFTWSCLNQKFAWWAWTQSLQLRNGPCRRTVGTQGYPEPGPVPYLTNKTPGPVVYWWVIQKGRPWFGTFANSHNVNTATTAHFKLSAWRWCYRMQLGKAPGMLSWASRSFQHTAPLDGAGLDSVEGSFLKFHFFFFLMTLFSPSNCKRPFVRPWSKERWKEKKTRQSKPQLTT